MTVPLTHTIKTRSQVARTTAHALGAMGVGDATAETRTLCDYVFKTHGSTNALNGHHQVTPEEEAAIKVILTQRQTGKPLAYIMGEAYFYNRPFAVKSGVLIPRQDSEVLIEGIKEAYPNPNTPLYITEVGVGSGCLLLTLLLEYPNATGIGTDIAPEAIEITQKNAEKYNLTSRLSLQKCADLPSSLKTDQNGSKLSIIVCNPPYIDQNDSQVSQETRMFEPELALFAPNNGLEMYARLIPKIAAILPKNAQNPNLFLEIGHTQAPAVTQLLQQNHFQRILLQNDLAERPRLLCVTS